MVGVVGFLDSGGSQLVVYSHAPSVQQLREDLISKDMKFHEVYQQYRERFKDFDGMIVVVEGEQPDA